MERAGPQHSPDRHRGERAAHAIYGSIVVLAVIVAQDGTQVTAGKVIGATLGAAVITALAEFYADYVGAMIRRGRHLTGRERAAELRVLAAGFLIALVPVVFFVLAAVGVMDLDSAFDAAIWTGVGTLGAYAVVANRLAGFPLARSLLIGAGFSAVAAALVILKAVL